MRDRLTFVDASRTAAILFAVGDHAMRHFGVMDLLTGPEKYPVALLFRSATPMFYLLFGMMIELVYLRYYQTGGTPTLFRKALLRSVQCYACFALVNIVGVMVTQREATWLAGPLSFAGNGIGAVGVLRFYTLAFLLLPFIVMLRAAIGRIAYPLLFAVFWLVALLFLAPSQSPDPCEAGPCLRVAFLYAGYAGSAYSLFHGLTIVFLGGMLAASFSATGLAAGWRRFLLSAAGIGVVLALAVVAFVAREGVGAFLRGFQTNAFRFGHHYVYYGFATATALTLLLFFYLVQQRFDMRPLTLLGRRSLFSFTAGGVLLNLFLAATDPIMLVPFVAIWIAVVVAYDRWQRRRKAQATAATASTAVPQPVA